MRSSSLAQTQPIELWGSFLSIAMVNYQHRKERPELPRAVSRTREFAALLADCGGGQGSGRTWWSTS